MPDSQPQDEPLVLKAQQGDLGAFEELIRHHQQPLFSFVFRMVNNPADAEELCQQTFIRAWQKLSSFKRKSSFKTWLYRIAINLTLNYKTRTRPAEPLDKLQLSDTASEPQQEYHQRLKARLVQEALLQLPPDQRTAIVLKVYENLSYREIARIMGKSVRAVDSLLVRARIRLKTLLQPAREKGQL